MAGGLRIPGATDVDRFYDPDATDGSDGAREMHRDSERHGHREKNLSNKEREARLSMVKIRQN